MIVYARTSEKCVCCRCGLAMLPLQLVTHWSVYRTAPNRGYTSVSRKRGVREMDGDRRSASLPAAVSRDTAGQNGHLQCAPTYAQRGLLHCKLLPDTLVASSPEKMA